MTSRVIIRHSTGSKAATVEEFHVSPSQELTFGREKECDIRYDKDRDEFVSRRHMKLVVGDPDRLEFTVVELSARNGTFVNRQRVRGTSPVKPGDVVQLGAGGPEFVFDVARIPARVIPEPPPQPVRSARRQKSKPRPKSARKKAAGVLTAVALAAGAVVFGIVRAEAPALEKVRQAARGLFSSGPEISKGALLTIVHRWRLVDDASGRQLRQVYIPNRKPAADGALAPGMGPELPVFVVLGANRLEPLLTAADREPCRPIATTATAVGFSVDESGSVLTTSQVARPWAGPYPWPADDLAGVAVVFDGAGKIARTGILARRQFPAWTPGQTAFAMDEPFDTGAAMAPRQIAARVASEGPLAHASGGQQMVATVTSVSDEQKVAALQFPAPIGPAFRVADVADLRSAERIQLLTDSGPKAGVLSMRSDGRFELTGIEPDPRWSGGPIVDSKGRVVAIEAGSLAVPIRRALDSLRP